MTSQTDTDRFSGWNELFFVILGALGLFLGMPNPVVQLPVLALLMPFALTRLGRADAGTRSRAHVFRSGWLTGFLGYSAVLYWIAYPVHEFGMLPWLLAAPCSLLLGAYVGLFPALFALLAREVCLRQPAVWKQLLLLGLGWYLLEWLRSVVLTGFPWLPLAAAFAPWPVMIQGAAVLGAFGLGGVLAAFAALASLGRRQAGYAACCLLVLAGCGWLWLQVPLAPAGPSVCVGLVQGNVNQNVKWEPAIQHATVNRYLELSSSALRKMPADCTERLLVWPETAMPFDMEKDGRFLPQIFAFAGQNRSTLIAGSVGFDAQARKFLNRAYLIRASGLPGGWYDKEHLVPFGEYVPAFMDFPFLDFLTQGIGQFLPGRATGPLPADPPGNALVPGVLICYEGIFPGLARDRVRHGATVLVNISNDAWFGKTAAATQHLHTSLLRAVELARPMARATNTGISAFVDARGRVVAQTGLFTASVLTAALTPSAVTTPYAVLAPWLPLLAVVLCALLWRRVPVAGCSGSRQSAAGRRSGKRGTAAGA